MMKLVTTDERERERERERGREGGREEGREREREREREKEQRMETDSLTVHDILTSTIYCNSVENLGIYNSCPDTSYYTIPKFKC